MTRADIIRDASSLGDILLAICQDLTRHHLVEAMHQQRVGERVGDVLVRLRLVSIADVARAVDLQRRMRTTGDLQAIDEMLSAARADGQALTAALKFMLPDTEP